MTEGEKRIARKVLSHLQKDMQEYKKGISEDKKLSKYLKKEKNKKGSKWR